MKLTIIIYVYVYVASKYVPWSTIVFFLVTPPLIRDYCSNSRRNPGMRWMSFSDGTGWETEEGPEFRWSISPILMILYLLYLVVSWLIDDVYSYCLVRIIIVISTIPFMMFFSFMIHCRVSIRSPFKNSPHGLYTGELDAGLSVLVRSK